MRRNSGDFLLEIKVESSFSQAINYHDCHKVNGIKPISLADGLRTRGTDSVLGEKGTKGCEDTNFMQRRIMIQNSLYERVETEPIKEIR